MTSQGWGPNSALRKSELTTMTCRSFYDVFSGQLFPPNLPPLLVWEEDCSARYLYKMSVEIGLCHTCAAGFETLRSFSWAEWSGCTDPYSSLCTLCRCKSYQSVVKFISSGTVLQALDCKQPLCAVLCWGWKQVQSRRPQFPSVQIRTENLREESTEIHVQTRPIR